MGPEITNPDYRDIPSKQHDQYYIDRVAELIKARLPGVKAEPSIVETCIYSVSYQALGSYCNTLDILVSLLSVFCSSVHRAETELISMIFPTLFSRLFLLVSNLSLLVSLAHAGQVICLLMHPRISCEQRTSL